MASASRLRRQSDPRVPMDISVLVELTPRTSRSALAGRRRRAAVAWRLGWRGGQQGVIERSRLRGETRLDREYDELGTVPRGEFYSVLLCWIYLHTAGSVLIATLAH